MKFIRKLLSIIFSVFGALFVLAEVLIVIDNNYETGTRIFAGFFGISVVIVTFTIAKWLWGTSAKIEKSFASNYSDMRESVEIKVPSGINYKLELSSPEPEIYNERNLISKYEFKTLQGFPANLFTLENYNGWKFLAALFLFLSVLYFLTGFIGFLFIQNNWSANQNQSSGVISFLWNFVFGNGASSKISTTVDLLFRLIIFICSYCLAWIAFDPKNVEGYAMGFFNSLIGIMYMFMPVDLMPDFIPVVGTLDDIFLGASMILLGASSWFKAKSRDTHTETILKLINDDNSEKAIQLLLEDKGIAVANKGNPPTKA